MKQFRCPYDLFGGIVPKGSIYKRFNTLVYSTDSSLSKYTLPKEIVETWESVWKQVNLPDTSKNVFVYNSNIEIEGKSFSYNELATIEKALSSIVTNTKVEVSLSVEGVQYSCEELDFILKLYMVS